MEARSRNELLRASKHLRMIATSDANRQGAAELWLGIGAALLRLFEARRLGQAEGNSNPMAAETEADQELARLKRELFAYLTSELVKDGVQGTNVALADQVVDAIRDRADASVQVATKGQIAAIAKDIADEVIARLPPPPEPATREGARSEGFDPLADARSPADSAPVIEGAHPELVVQAEKTTSSDDAEPRRAIEPLWAAAIGTVVIAAMGLALWMNGERRVSAVEANERKTAEDLDALCRELRAPAPRAAPTPRASPRSFPSSPPPTSASSSVAQPDGEGSQSGGATQQSPRSDEAAASERLTELIAKHCDPIG